MIGLSLLTVSGTAEVRGLIILSDRTKGRVRFSQTGASECPLWLALRFAEGRLDH
jgi:hypothetical protein